MHRHTETQRRGFDGTYNGSQLKVKSTTANLVPAFQQISCLAIVLVIRGVLLIVYVISSYCHSEIETVIDVERYVEIILINSASFLGVKLSIRDIGSHRPVKVSTPFFAVFIEQMALPAQYGKPTQILVTKSFTAFKIFTVFHSIRLISHLIGLGYNSITRCCIQQSLHAHILIERLRFVIVESEVHIPQRRLITYL